MDSLLQKESLNFIDMTNDQPDLNLLREAYEKLLQAHFPNQDHLESFEAISYPLTTKSTPFSEKSHILLLTDEQGPIGILNFEYYPVSNVGLGSYLVILEKYRGKKLANYLIFKAKEILQMESAKRLKNLKDCQSEWFFVPLGKFLNLETDQLIELLKQQKPSIFLETEKENDFDPIMDPKLRLKVYEKMGFEKINMVYYQPNLSKEQKPVSLYLLASTDLCEQENDEFYMDSRHLVIFIWEFGHEVSEEDFVKSEKFFEMIKSIGNNKVYLK